MNKEIMAKVLRYITDEEDEDIKRILQSWLHEQIVRQELMFE